MVNGIVIVVGVVIVIAIFVWLGLKIRPASFHSYPKRTPQLETVPLPRGLPAPVERYYRQMYGAEIPVIKSAVITGRGKIRFMGVFLPARFRFTHEAGQNYRHYIETTFFGFPILKINEYYVNGKERMEVPTGVMENNPKLDQGGLLGMWAESIEWLPAILVTDPQVKWEPVDDDAAFLVVPFGNDKGEVSPSFRSNQRKNQVLGGHALHERHRRQDALDQWHLVCGGQPMGYIQRRGGGIECSRGCFSLGERTVKRH